MKFVISLFIITNILFKLNIFIKNSMTKILLPPYYLETNNIRRISNSLTMVDYLHSLGHTPIIPCFASFVDSFESAKILSRKYIDLAEGIIFMGGSDINPKFYNQVNYYAHGCIDFRDYFEITLLKESLSKKIPIMGICRGFQLINIVLGGSLHQHLKVPEFQKHDFGSSEDYVSHSNFGSTKTHHLVKLNKNGIIAKNLKITELETNSYHHQGIDKLGNNLQIEGQTEDGLIEAFSNEEKKILATQWHPENDFNNKNYKNIINLWLKFLIK